MSLAVRILQPWQALPADHERRVPVPLWSAEGPVAILGDYRDAEGFPVPVVSSPRTLFGPRRCCLVSEHGRLWIADTGHHRLLGWRRCPTEDGVPADWVIGQPDLYSEGADTLYWPYGVSAWGEALVVADTGNRRVLIWLTPPERNGQPADLVLGQAGFDRRDDNAGGEPSAMSMRWPHAITRWGDALCVADAGNNRLMIWDRMPAEPGAECQWIVGQPDAAQVDHNGGQYWPHAGTLNMPYGVAAAGDWLVVADTANSRLLGWHKRDLATGAKAQALAGQPTFEMKGDNQWAFPSRDTLCWPYGLSICRGLLAIADSGNNRVMIRPLHREVSG